jgi:hypothetical protein
VDVCGFTTVQSKPSYNRASKTEEVGGGTTARSCVVAGVGGWHLCRIESGMP